MHSVPSRSVKIAFNNGRTGARLLRKQAHPQRKPARLHTGARAEYPGPRRNGGISLSQNSALIATHAETPSVVPRLRRPTANPYTHANRNNVVLEQSLNSKLVSCQ